MLRQLRAAWIRRAGTRHYRRGGFEDVRRWMDRRGVTVEDLKAAFADDPGALVLIEHLAGPPTPPAVAVSPGSIAAPAGADAALVGEFAARGPWVTCFWIDGVAYGGYHDLSRDPRLDLAERVLGPFTGKRVLELGALEGGHSITLARRGATVVALEGRDANIARARWVASLLGIDTVRFVVADVRTADFAAHGPFDFVLNSGLLYHLDRPWELLARLAPVAPAMLVWTHFVEDGQATRSVTVEGEELRGWDHGEFGLGDPLSGLQSKSFWPTHESLIRMLALTGWDIVTAEVERRHPDGPAITFVARRRERVGATSI